MKTLISILFCFVFIFSSGALLSQTHEDAANSPDEQQVIKWLENLIEPGVSLDNDTILVNEESTRLLNDAAYRLEMYPKEYTWEKTILFISKQQLKQAFWYMINLYQENDKNKELVLRSFMTYDQLFKMDNILVSTFYTYIYMDLGASKFVDGTPVVTAPDVMEGKLNTLKDILYYMDKYRQRRNEQSAHK